MSQPKGKIEIKGGFIAAFMQAYETANKTGKVVKIEDHPGWSVRPLKDLKTEE